jgi:hypothetical protein
MNIIVLYLFFKGLFSVFLILLQVYGTSYLLLLFWEVYLLFH